ncbi:hypothetical protein C0991_002648, partial [Blastosporella zonata]
MGHTIDNCYWKGRGKEGQFPPNFGKRGCTTLNATTPVVNMANAITDDQYPTYTLTIKSLLQFAPAGVYTNAIEPMDAYLPRLPPSNVTAYQAGITTPTYADLGA